MLRARPVHFTSRPDEWDRLLTALGMVKTADGMERREYDAGAGRLVLRPAAPGSGEDGTTAFGVEVGDLEEFARRTNLAGAETGSTPAELLETDQGPSCRITGGDGFSFLAEKATGPGSAGADPALAVVEVWFTEDTAAAAGTLRSIGARLRPAPDNDETADFTAKNGGVLMVRPGLGPARAGLGFEYGGDLDSLLARLTAAGYQATLAEEAFGRSLHLPNPDADGPGAHHPALWVASARLGGGV